MVSVGELLNKERVRKNISLKQIEKEIKIREKQLLAIEENDWSSFSSKIYITGIIRNYARYLELDPNKMIIFFRRDYEKKEEVKFKKRVSTSYLKPQTKRVIYSVLFIIFFLFFVYFAYQLKMFLSPPSVVILAPTVEKIKSENVKIVGKTEKEASITIFDEKVYPNKDGFFEYILPLTKDRNPVVIEVTGGNGKKTVIKREFIHER